MRYLESWVLEYLANSVWQIPLVFAAAWLAARNVRRLGAKAEHRVWCSAVLLAAVLPACAFDLRTLLPWLAQHASASAAGVTVTTGAVHAYNELRLSQRLEDAVLAGYLCIVTYFASRLGWGLWQTRRLRRQAKAMPLTADAALSWQSCRRRFGVESAEIAVSSGVYGPVTIGVFRRLLLLPESWLGTAPEEDIGAAMAHECAHIQRRDFAKNLLYRVATLPVAYHPLLWLMRARLVETREMVCDALAAEAVAGRQQYAHSLVRLAGMIAGCKRNTNLHAIGIFDANNLERRVMMLTEKKMEVRRLRRVVVAAACIVLGAGTCASALAFHMNLAEPNAPRPSASQEAGTATGLKVKSRVMQGNIITKVNPVYPQAAKDAKIQGAVVLRAVIGKDGAVENLQVVSGPAELQESAIEAVKQWIYKPYLLNGNPTEVETTIEVNYSLQP
jgi:TonB family protein